MNTKSKFNKGVKNLVFSFIGQIITISLSIFVPRLFILHYGSPINGLFALVSQVFTYFALLEAGVGGATIQALYKPLAKNDEDVISGILRASRDYYRKIALWYFICTLLFSVFYPLLVKSNINKIEIIVIILLQGMAGAGNYIYQAAFRQMLTADGRSYVVSNIGVIISIITNIGKIISIYYDANIIIVQAIYFIISLLQIPIYYFYMKRYFPWINYNVVLKKGYLKQKYSILIHQISGLIFNNSDLIVLSIFTNLSTISVYVVYNMVITFIVRIISTIHSSLSFTLGHLYNESMEMYIKLHDAYHTYYTTLVFSLTNICYILFTPFIILYTQGADINYNIKYLALLFSIIQLLSAVRIVACNLALIAKHMRETIWRTLLEASINLIISIILVKYIGIYGVLIGTIVALLYRTNDAIIYADVKILKRNCYKSYKPIIINTLLFILEAIINSHLNLIVKNYYNFIICGIITTCVIIPIYFFIVSIFSKNEFKFIYGILSQKFKRV